MQPIIARLLLSHVNSGPAMIDALLCLEPPTRNCGSSQCCRSCILSWSCVHRQDVYRLLATEICISRFLPGLSSPGTLQYIGLKSCLCFRLVFVLFAQTSDLHACAIYQTLIDSTVGQEGRQLDGALTDRCL